MALNSHTSGGYWHSILTPRGATGTGARDTGATGMLPYSSDRWQDAHSEIQVYQTTSQELWC